MMVMKFWKVMNTLLNTIFVCRRNVPRTASMGFTADIIIAGSQPATPPTRRANATIAPIQTGERRTDISNCTCSKFPASGAMAKTRNIATTKEKRHRTTDSITSRQNSSARLEPSSLRVAISLARNPACATERLI